MNCPITGQICLKYKALQIAEGVNICGDCEIASWQDFLRNIFHLMQIDQILSPSEIQQVISTIKSKNDLDVFFSKLKQTEQRVADSTPCPLCGLDLHSLLAQGRFGCGECYTHFKDIAKAVVSRVQEKAQQHIGKSPKCDVGIMKKEMDKAVKEERYEDAAKLRDKIKGFLQF